MFKQIREFTIPWFSLKELLNDISKLKNTCRNIAYATLTKIAKRCTDKVLNCNIIWKSKRPEKPKCLPIETNWINYGTAMQWSTMQSKKGMGTMLLSYYREISKRYC